MNVIIANLYITLHSSSCLPPYPPHHPRRIIQWLWIYFAPPYI